MCDLKSLSSVKTVLVARARNLRDIDAERMDLMNLNSFQAF